MKFTENTIVDLTPLNKDMSTATLEDLVSVAAYYYDKEYEKAFTKPCYKHPDFAYEWLKMIMDAAEQPELWTFKVDIRNIVTLQLKNMVYTTASGKEFPVSVTNVYASLAYNGGYDTFTFTADYGDKHYCGRLTTEELYDILIGAEVVEPPAENPDEGEEPTTPTEPVEPPTDEGNDSEDTLE